MKTILFVVFTGLSTLTTVAAQNRAELESVMDAWATEYFNDCFTGLEYRSISVSDFSISSSSLYVKGYVSYLNLLGISVRWEYNATMTPLPSRKIKIKFNKYDGFRGKWDICERTIY